MGVLVTPDPTFMLNERGGPVPPQAVLQRMKADCGEEFSLRFMANLDASHWAVTREWPVTDTRWQRVRSQEIPPESAYDIIGHLPIDCPLEQAADYVRKALKAYPLEEIRKLADRVSTWNSVAVPQQQVAQVVTDTLEDVGRALRPQNPRRSKVVIEKVLR